MVSKKIFVKFAPTWWRAGSRTPFFHIRFWSVELSVRTHNTAGINLYEKVGFKKVGLLKEIAFIDDTYCDEFMCEIILW